jgi:hypothetical protein
MSSTTPDKNAYQREPKSGELPSIGDEITTFIEEIDSLSSSLHLAQKVAATARDKIADTMSKFTNKYGTLVDETDVMKSFSIALQHAEKGAILKKQYEHVDLALSILPRSFLVSLYTQFDAFFARLIRVLYFSKPELLEASGNTLSFAELVELKSVDAAREFVLEREVDAVLRKSPAEQFTWLENKFGVQLRKDSVAWHTFLEAMERSHHFVHRRGVVSQRYIDVCRALGIPVDGVISVGDILPASTEYVDSAYRALYEISVNLAHIFWRTLKPAELETADRNMLNITRDLMAGEKYKLAIALLDFSVLTLKHFSDDEMRRTFIINRAQAYKWNRQEKLCSLILSQEEWTGQPDHIQLAVAVLSDNYQLAGTLMEKIGAREDRGISYKESPLFKEFRKSAEFLRVYEKVFGARFTNVEQFPKKRVA